MLNNENDTIAFLRYQASQMQDQMDHLRKHGFVDQRLKKRYDDTLEQIRIIVRSKAIEESNFKPKYPPSMQRRHPVVENARNQLRESQCSGSFSFFHDDELPTVLTEEEMTQPAQQSRK